MHINNQNKKSTVRLKKSISQQLDLFTLLVGRKSWTLILHHCTGKWRGTTDYGVQFEDGLRYYIGNGMKYFESRLQEEIDIIRRVRNNREKYLHYFRERALIDNSTSIAEGLFPISVIDVRLNTESEHLFLWPYLLLELNGTQFKFIESGMCYNMKNDEMEKWVEHCKRSLFTAAGVQQPDFIFGNVRHSSTENHYKIE